MADKEQENEEDAFIGPMPKKIKEQDVQNKTVLVRRQPKAPFWKQNEEEPPKEKQISEAEMQLKNMLHKQLDTKITLKSELTKKKQFQQSSLFKDDQEQRSGAHTLDSFKQSILKLEEGGNFAINPAETTQGTNQAGSSELISSELGDRIKLHKDSSSFTNAKEMTRHEIEIEQSLCRGTKKADDFKHLIKAKPHEYSVDDPVMKTLKDYEEMEARKRRNAKRHSKYSLPTNDGEISDEENENGAEFIGPVLAPLHIRVKPLDETEVQRNRLTIEEIKSIKKFCNYETGTPSKKLYLKNLPRDVTKEDLASLFVRFESMDVPCMEYRILDGRMRGQAFISFQDEFIAAKALEFANGFILNGKPIIIAFGRDGKSS